MRVRISLGPGLDPCTHPRQFWWEIPNPPTSISIFTQQVLAAAGIPAKHVRLTLDGFDVLPSSSTSVLQIGDVLDVSLAPDQGTQKDTILDTLQRNGNPPVDALDVSNRPSRSARRKAAKRRRRRLGLDNLPPPGGQRPPKRPRGSPSESSDKQLDSESKPRESSPEKLNSHSSSGASEETESSSSLPGEEESDEAFLKLPRCDGMPPVGSAIAYKLLEIDLNLTPVVSEWRKGKVTSTDPTSNMVTVEQLGFKHTFVHQRNQKHGSDGVLEDEGFSSVPTDYDEDGTLATQMTSFVDVRLLTQSIDTKQNGEDIALAQRKDSFGPASYCKLGPPRPPRNAVLFVAEEPVGSQTAQGKTKKAEQEGQDRLQSREIIDRGGDEGGPSPITNPDKTPPPKRSRSFHSAVGPILRLLRNSQQPM